MLDVLLHTERMCGSMDLGICYKGTSRLTRTGRVFSFGGDAVQSEALCSVTQV